MNILYLHQYFNTPEMPGSTRSYEMARRLVAAGHKVNMITSWREPSSRANWFETEEDGINVHWLPVPYSNYMSYRKRIMAFCCFAWNAARKAASLPSDVIFATSTPLTIALPSVYSARKQKVPMVFEVRDLWPELPIAIGAIRNPLFKWTANRLEEFAYRNSEKIVALSPGMRDGIIKKGYSPENIYVIPNSSDIDEFSVNQAIGKNFRDEHGIKHNAILVVYTGTFGRINGVDYLIRIAHQLMEDKRFHFLTVGDGVDFSKVKSLAQILGVLGKNVTMLPSIPKSEIPAVLAAADVATSLFIPLKEMEANSANKFFDGLAAGCCIAINYGGWHSELLSSYRAGLQLDKDISQAALQLKEFLDCSEKLIEAKTNARHLAEQCFSRDLLAKKLEQVFTEIGHG